MSTSQSLFLSIQYPGAIGELSEDKFDALLTSLQKDPALYEYECTLWTLTIPSGEAVPVSTPTPSLYCKTAPPYVTSKTDKLIPRILVELTFAVAVSSVEADVITETVDRLIREHLLPDKSNVSIKILVTSLSNGPSQKAVLFDGHLPLPYYQLHDQTQPRVSYSIVVLLAILCLGILLINFTLHFHFQ